jgi:hypothetical protein
MNNGRFTEPFVLDISALQCPCCEHTNGEHAEDGKCGACICRRHLVLQVVGASGNRDRQPDD